MKHAALHTIAAGLLVYSGTAFAGGALSFEREVTIDSSPATVWKYVGDFNALDLWHPSVRKSTLTGKSNKAGAIRVLKLSDGQELTEKLLNYSAAKTQYTYTTIKGPFPIKNYVSTISVSPTADGKTLMKWSSTFDAEGIDEDLATEWIAIAYDGGLGKVVSNFEKTPPAATPP